MLMHVGRKWAAITGALVLTAGGIMMFMSGGPQKTAEKAANKDSKS